MIQYGQYGDKERQSDSARFASAASIRRLLGGARRGSTRLKAMSIVLLAALTLVAWPGLAAAASLLRIAGFVDVVPAALTLPLALGAAPVTITVQIGAPAVSVPIQVSPLTLVLSETGLPVTLTDGDRIKVDALVTDGGIQAIVLVLEEFPEIQTRGTASGLPAGGITLPLSAGTTVAVHVAPLAGVDVPLVLTDKTKTRMPGHLANGQTVRVEAVVRNSQLLVTEIAVLGN